MGHNPVRILYKGKNVGEDFIVHVHDQEGVKQYRKDSSVPLVEVCAQFKVFVTHQHGAQGVLDEASHAMLDSEFGTHTDDEVIKQIVLHGDVQNTKDVTAKGDKFSNKNDSKFIVNR